MTNKLLVFILLLSSASLGHAQEVDSLVTATVAASEILRTEEGNIAGAISMLEPLLERLEKEGTHNPLSLVPLYHKLGVNYYFFGNNIKAERYTGKALMIREKEYGKVHIDVARGYFLRASLNKQLQQYNNAQKDLNQAISSMETLLETGASKDTLRLIWMFEESVRLHSTLRNNTLALQFWNKAYDYYSQAPEPHFADIISLYNNKGHIYYNQQKFDLSEQAYKKAINIFEREGQPSALLELIAINYSDLGVMLFEQGKYTAAAHNYQIAQRYFDQLLENNESLWLHQKQGIVYLNMLEYSGEIKDYKTSETYFNRAFEHFTAGCNTPYHVLFATLYQEKAQISFERGKYTEALALNQKSLHALLPDFKSEDPLQFVNLTQHAVKDKLAFLENLRQKSAILMAMHSGQKENTTYIQAAFHNYQTLDTVITQIRQSYNAAGSQFELIEQSYPIYEQAIQTACMLFEQKAAPKYLEAAYHFAAKNKALVLLGGIQEEEAKKFSAIPMGLKEQERSLKQAIFQLESKLYEQSEDERNPVLKDSLFSLRRDYQKLINHFEETYPDYYSSKYGFDKSIEIAKLQQQLNNGTALIEYFVGEEQLFVFTVTKTGFDYLAMNKPENFDQYTWSFREQLQSQINATDQFLVKSYQLYQWLLEKPLAKPLVQGIDHLVIIPDGVLLQLPFDVLVQDSNPSPSYLLRKYSISYAYSNQLLFKPEKQHPALRVFAGYGLEYDDYTLAGLATYVDSSAINLPLTRALGKLQYSDDEVQEIAALLTGEQWTNDAATRQAFLENADQYAILHMAMHGILNEQYPMNSALVFSRQNDTTNYFLRAADLYNMQLNAEMVVLSACNTGAGTLQKGEGVRSLARAFSFAGCPSLIASLWSASDKATKDILIEFYKNLKQGMSKDQAMRQAKLAYLDSAPPAYQSPFFWSHLSVIGDSDQLQILAPSFVERHWPWGLVLIAVLGGLFFFRRRSV